MEQLLQLAAANQIVLTDLFQCESPDMAYFRGLTVQAGETERSLLARIVAESAAAFATPLNAVVYSK